MTNSRKQEYRETTRPSASRRIRRLADSMAQGSMAVAMVAAPLSYGSVTPGWTALWTCVLAVSVGCSLLALGRNARLDGLLPFIATGSACLLCVLVQGFWTPPLSWAHEAWGELATAGIGNAAPRLSADPASGATAMTVALCPLLGLIAAYLIAMRQQSSWNTIKLIVFSGLCYALIGGLVQFFMPGNVLLEAKVAYQNDFTGPFVNRNTAASYFGLCTLGAAILAFRAFRAKPLPRLNSFPVFADVVSRLLLSRASVWTVCTLILLATTLKTGSRAGSAACVAGLLVMAFALTFRVARSRRTMAIWAVVAIGAMIGAADLLSANLGTRIAEGFGGDGRTTVWSAAFTALTAHPWIGTGAGSFEDIFPSIRPDALGYSGIWDRAHSTPLELAVTIGLPASLLILAAWAMLIYRHASGLFQSRESYALPALGLAALAMMTIHGAVDFSLQIAGFAIPFAIVVGTTFGQTTRRAILREQERSVRS